MALAAAVVISSSNAFAAVGDIAPTVTTQPADQVVAAGADATFTSAASATPAATVQWQVSTGGGVFSDVAGAISLTFTVANTTLAMSGNAYRAVFTNSAGSATSNAALLTVNKAITFITTSATTSATTGGAMLDTATLSGGNLPTGTIGFDLFGPNDLKCSGTPVFTSTAIVDTGNASYPSGSFSPILSGVYRWVAAYSGDALNSAATTACADPGETTTVSKFSTTLGTSATASVLLGGAILDVARLSGGNLPTGTITFSLFGPNNATCWGTPVFTSTATVAGNGSYPSGSFSPLLLGDYRWIAAYGGDANNYPSGTSCDDFNETSTVTKVRPTITTQATASVNTGGAISDSAILAGGNAPTGTINFSLFGPDDATCSGTALFTSTATVASGNGSYPSGAFSPLLPGAYRWVASYGGDGSNYAATSHCNDAGETSTVTKASPTITTQATATVNIGGAISDTALLAGGNTPTGSVTFTVFGPNNPTCAGTAVFTSTTAVSGDGSYPSGPFTPTLTGTYSWVASYSGDAANNAAPTACNDPGETSTVSNATPTITTSATPSANTGGAISDTAILAGGNAPTGTITFTLFGPNDTTCSGTSVFTSTKAVTGAGSYPSDPFSPTLAGAYSWIAAYSGDAGNNAAITACNDPGETSTVTAASSQDVMLSMFKVGGFQSGGVGAFIVIVTNTGATDTTGTLTFTDVLPAGLTFLDRFTFDEWTCSVAGQTVTCTFAGSLPAHDVTAFALFVRVAAGANTILTNTATLTPSDATPDDNTASVTLTVSSSNDDEWEFGSHGNNASHETNRSGSQSRMEAG